MRFTSKKQKKYLKKYKPAAYKKLKKPSVKKAIKKRK